MEAGKLTRQITIERLPSGVDSWGQPYDTWQQVGKLWAHISHETGMGAIRSRSPEGIPTSIARYSFKVRRESLLSLGIDVGMRVSYASMYFDIKTITHNLNKNDESFLICEQGGSSG